MSACEQLTMRRRLKWVEAVCVELEAAAGQSARSFLKQDTVSERLAWNVSPTDTRAGMSTDSNRSPNRSDREREMLMFFRQCQIEKNIRYRALVNNW